MTASKANQKDPKLRRSSRTILKQARAIRDEAGVRVNSMLAEADLKQTEGALDRLQTVVEREIDKAWNLGSLTFSNIYFYKEDQKAIISIKDDQKAISTLKNYIQISETVKNYHAYFSKDMGFHGGTLGSTINRQLENIAFMAKAGGITLPDVKILTTMVCNAAPGLVAEKERSHLENIFSAIASVLLFNDSGAEVKRILSKVEEAGDPKFLHLYELNGVLVP